MKTTLLVTLVATLFILCACSNHKTTLHITVGEPDASEIFLYAPNRATPDTLQASGEGLITVEFPNDRISRVMLVYSQASINFFAEPDREYNLNLTRVDKKGKITIDDEAQQQYYKLSSGRNMYKYEWVKDYSKAPYDTIGSVMANNFRQLIADDQIRIDSIETSVAMHKMFQKDTELYWLSALSKILINNFFNSSKKGTPMYPEYFDTWKSLYEQHPVSEEYLQSGWMYHYAQAYLYYIMCQQYNGERPSKTPEDFWDYQYNFVYNNIEGEKVQEAIAGQFLFMDCLNNSTHNKALIGHINNFLEKFPATNDRKFFENYIADEEEYYRIVSGDFSPGVKFVENANQLNTLQKVIDNFKGKPLFIDFWFSTCHPCVGEFGHSEPLKEFLKQNDIQLLYLSTDGEKMDENWKNTIKRYNLEGNHIRATQDLHKDMYEAYRIYAYPHYMIVDANGKIVVKKAKRPSSGDELINQIKTELNL